MLSLLALIMLLTFMALIVSGRCSPMVALVLTPLVFGLIGGFGGQLAPMMLDGVRQLAPTGVLLCFAILYFCLMSDVGLFDPLIRWIVRIVDRDPLRIVVGSGVLGLAVSLDGDGSTTYIICCSAMMPIYRRMGMNPLILACLLTLSCGITNITPWGGATAKVSSALALEVSDVFTPLIPGMIVAALFVVFVAYLLGRRERRRLGNIALSAQLESVQDNTLVLAPERRPKHMWLNCLMTAALLVCLVLEALPLAVLFIVACSLALMINYPSIAAQTERLQAHAPSILRVITVIFAAGIFVGIMNGSGMATSLGKDVVELIPPQWGPHLGVITGLISIPFTFFMVNEGFFFGVLPILAEAAGHYGIEPVEIARAALVSQTVHILSPVVASTHLLVALAQVEFGSHQRFTLKWALYVSLIILAVTVAIGAISFRAGL